MIPRVPQLDEASSAYAPLGIGSLPGTTKLPTVLLIFWDGGGSMRSVWLLHHVHEFEDGHEDGKLIGVFATREEAESAQRARS